MKLLRGLFSTSSSNNKRGGKGQQPSAGAASSGDAPGVGASDQAAPEREASQGGNEIAAAVPLHSRRILVSVTATYAPRVLTDGLRRDNTGDGMPCAFSMRDPRIREARSQDAVILEVMGMDEYVDEEQGRILVDFIGPEHFVLARESCKFGARCHNFELAHREAFWHPEVCDPQAQAAEAEIFDLPAEPGQSATKAFPARGPGSLPFALIAPPKADASTWAGNGGGPPGELPTVLAISGDEQLHVSPFFRSWGAESVGWQVVVPLRLRMGTPYLFDPDGVESVVRLMQELLADKDRRLLPFRVEAARFHLVGVSNGAAAALAAASHTPELVSSLSMVAGFAPDALVDVSPLRHIPSISMYVGSEDRTGHLEALVQLSERLHSSGVLAQLHLVEGAGHGSIGRLLDQDAFWTALESGRFGAAASSPPPGGASSE